MVLGEDLLALEDLQDEVLLDGADSDGLLRLQKEEREKEQTSAMETVMETSTAFVRQSATTSFSSFSATDTPWFDAGICGSARGKEETVLKSTIMIASW